MNKLKTNILTALYKEGEDGMREKDIAKALELPKKTEKKLSDALEGMK